MNTVDLDPGGSRLVAQVRKADASHKMDTSNRLLRSRHFQGPSTVVYLGDVAQAVLAHLNHPETTVFTHPPGYNEQRWTLETRSGDLVVTIESFPYWGFGLLTSGYMNVVALEGPLAERARLVLDVVSSLGQPPWELAHPKRAERVATKLGLPPLKHNETEWKQLHRFAHDALNDALQDHAHRLQSLEASLEEDEDNHLVFQGLRDDLHMGKSALAEDNAPGVERALARMEAGFIQLRPGSVHVRTGEVDVKEQPLEVLGVGDDVTFVDLTGVNDGEE